MRPIARAAVLDAVLIVVFAAVGRNAHHVGHPLTGALGTAWPFLAGALLGWLVVLGVPRTSPLTVRTGWPVWLATVAGGMILRRLTGQGIAFSFIVVALVVLGAFLMGWRLVLGVLGRRRRTQPVLDARH